jgi:bacillopeptidase F (M6 metalloprotease family)
MTAGPQALGVVSQLGDLNVQSINKYSEGQPKRGWYMAQMEAMALPNAHALVRGQKS